MSVYYIRKPADRKKRKAQKRLLESLEEEYGIVIYQAYRVISGDEALNIMLSNMAEDVIHPEIAVSYQQSAVSDQQSVVNNFGELVVDNILEVMDKPAVEEKSKRKARILPPPELCPKCGKMGQLTRKGYCKICAMRIAKETKNGQPERLSVGSQEARTRKTAAGQTLIIEPGGHNPEYLPEVRRLKGHRVG